MDTHTHTLTHTLTHTHTNTHTHTHSLSLTHTHAHTHTRTHQPAMNSNMYDTDPYAITTGTTYIRKQFSYPGNLKSTTPPEMFLKEATKEIHCPTTHAHLDWNASMDGLQVVETDFQVQLSSACHYILTIISCTLKAHIVSTLTFMY